jgi:hypothetical protein
VHLEVWTIGEEQKFEELPTITSTYLYSLDEEIASLKPLHFLDVDHRHHQLSAAPTSALTSPNDVDSMLSTTNGTNSGLKTTSNAVHTLRYRRITTSSFESRND